MKKIFLTLILALFFTNSYADQFLSELQNFWLLAPENCKLNMYYNEGEEKTKIVLNCPDGETIYELNFAAVLGYANPQPAEGSTFVLEKRNLNYLTKPEVDLKIHITYLGNNNLKAEIKTRDFSWNEILKINFENELLCPADLECGDFVLNDKISELVRYFENNSNYAPYLQELLNKIVENKDTSYDMARVSAIFIKDLLFSIINVDKLYSSGLVFGKLAGGHCKYDECCITKYWSKTGKTETYCWPKYGTLITDP